MRQLLSHFPSQFLYQVLKTTGASVLDRMDYCCYSASRDISVSSFFDYFTAYKLASLHFIGPDVICRHP